MAVSEGTRDYCASCHDFITCADTIATLGSEKATKLPRISLVVEQYKIDEQYYPFTIEFEFSKKAKMNMM